MIASKKRALLLLVGDILLFYASLWIMLSMRYGFSFEEGIFFDHFIPFSILILLWILVFFIAGLYDKGALFFKRRLPAVLFNAQVANTAIAIGFFYIIPYFGITPKTNLFTYLVISFILILLWRLYGAPFILRGRMQQALLIGSGSEKDELYKEINTNPRYTFYFSENFDLETGTPQDLARAVDEGSISVVVIDMHKDTIGPVLPHLYNLLFSRVRFLDMAIVYEELFDRIPLSLITYEWFLNNISPVSHVLYDVLKRFTDIIVALLLGVASLPLYPIVYLAIKLDDKGPVFLRQERVGQNNKRIEIIKFRTMSKSESDGGKWVVENDPRITRVGRFLRTTRIDELPQLWNVLWGDISLVGPRPELPDLVKLYEREIPYYGIRHLIKPGLSGWGQIHHEKPPHSIEETKEKLSYDLYYIKNRSLLLDLEIALKTIKTLLSRSGI